MNSAGAKFDGKFRWPTDSHLVTSGYGPRGGRNHDGIDIGVPIGTAVKASASGKVTAVGVQGGYGNAVEVRHDATYTTLYAHLDSFDCKVGDTVRVGERIARSGNTGRSTGPHLHFEIRRGGGAIDPRSKLP